MLGRLLPTLIAAGAFIVVAETAAVGPGREIDTFVRTPDGRFIGWDEAWPDYMDPDTGQPLHGVTEMARYVPIEIYPQVAARYALLHLVIGLMGLTIAFAVVERRSP